MRADADRPRARGREARSSGASIDETGPLIGGLLSQVPDIDPAETGEWLESLDGLIDDKGGPRARYVMLSLLRHARQRNVAIPVSLNTPYVNTIAVHDEPYFPPATRSWSAATAPGSAGTPP